MKAKSWKADEEEEEDICILKFDNINRELSPYQKHRLVEETKENDQNKRWRID